MPTCPYSDDCAQPGCRGRAWTLEGSTKENVDLFLADVRADMQRRGSRDFGKAAARVAEAARRAPCMFE